MDDETVTIGGVTLGVRLAGPPDGSPVLHFHGTPGSRLEMAWADDELERAGVRLAVFDRPGYGRSTPGRFSLTSVARLGLDLVDRLGWARFATMGWSGGGPFALATAALAPDRVQAVCVIAGAGPFQEIPGVLDLLEGGDAEAVALLPADPVGAAATFATTFAGLLDLADEAGMLAALGPALSERDKETLADPAIGPAILRDMQEAFRQGADGGGWDNVSWVGDWDFALDSVRAPVSLWYGDEDLMAPMPFGTWLAEHLPDARLEVLPGYGHLTAPSHLPQMLARLLER